MAARSQVKQEPPRAPGRWFAAPSGDHRNWGSNVIKSAISMERVERESDFVEHQRLCWIMLEYMALMFYKIVN